LVINLAASGNDAALYERYRETSKAATDPEVRYPYLFGLTSFTDPALVRRTIDIALSDEVRSQDAELVIGNLLRNRQTSTLAWRLVRDRWNEIQKKSGESIAGAGIVGSVASFCEASSGAEVSSFFKEHKVPNAERTLQQALERIDACAKSAAVQAPKLAEWLRAR
jgi:aminopeptidase N